MVTITEWISYAVQYLKTFQFHFGEQALLLFELVFCKRSLLCLSDTSLTAGVPEEEAGEHLEWWLVQVSLALYSLPVESTGSQHGNNALQLKVFVMCGTRVDHFISSPLFPSSFVGEDFKKMKFFKEFVAI